MQVVFRLVVTLFHRSMSVLAAGPKHAIVVDTVTTEEMHGLQLCKHDQRNSAMMHFKEAP